MGKIFSFRVKNQQNRDEYVDFLRGLAMILVLMQHADIPHSRWILAFHMPVFFVLSGYTASFRKQTAPFWTYLKSKLQRLVVPYFLFETLNLIVWLILKSGQGVQTQLPEAVRAIVMCLNTPEYTGFYGRLWFWPCMFVADLYFYIIRKICRDNGAGLAASFAIMLALSWYTSNQLNMRLPFAVDTACMATVCLLAGYGLSGVLSWLIKEKHILWDTIILAVLLCIMRISVHYGYGYCLMYNNEYGPFGWSVIAAFSGSFAFIVIAKWLYALFCFIKIGKKCILWYGCNSLVIFPVHLSVKIFVMNVVWGFAWNSGIGFISHYSDIITSWYVLLIAMLVTTVPLTNLIMQYFPFMAGVLPKQGKRRVFRH